MDTVLKPIAFIHTDFPSKFGIPRQGNLVPELKAMLVFEKEHILLNGIKISTKSYLETSG